MADEFIGFARDAYSFWKGLERNNNRQWFQAHKVQYEQAVRRPMQLLIEELEPFRVWLRKYVRERFRAS